MSRDRTARGARHADGRQGPSTADRVGAWALTGPVGRVVAFAGDLGAALGGWALRRVGLRREGGQ